MTAPVEMALGPREAMASLAEMVRISWAADRMRSVGSALTAGALPVTRTFRAVGLGLLTEGVVTGRRPALAAGVAVLVGLSALGRMLDWSSLTLIMRLREQTIKVVDQQVMRMVAGIPGLEHHERPAYADQLALLRADRGYLVNPFMAISRTLGAAVQVVATVAVLAGLDPVLALLPVVGLPSLLAGTSAARAQDRLRRAQAEDNRLLWHLRELATTKGAAKEVRIFDLGPELLARHREEFSRLERAWVANDVRTTLVQAAGWTIFALGYMGGLALVAARVLGHHLAIGDVVVVVSLGAQLNGQLAELAQMRDWLSRTVQAMGRYRWLAGYSARAEATLPSGGPLPGPGPARGPASPVPDGLRAGIALKGVSFTYPGTEMAVLRDLDFNLAAGQTVAIVGANGAGKTTLAKLLCRFYEPTAGRIELDGRDLAAMAPALWRERISACFQDFARLELTAGESVGVGRLEAIADRAAVGRALDRAGAGDLAARLPAGLGTQLGREWEGGVELSVGQWQKVALGRAMMRPNPLLLVLDEPTASLDAPSEQALFERWGSAARQAAVASGAVTVVVSHRFSTVRRADLILVMDGGGVAEAGTHGQLMDAGGLYAELYSLQAQGYR